MCPYQQIAIGIGPGALDSAALVALMLGYAWRVANQALSCPEAPPIVATGADR